MVIGRKRAAIVWCLAIGLCVAAPDTHAQLAPISGQQTETGMTAPTAEGLQPLPGLAPLPFGGAGEEALTPGLLAEKEQLFEIYQGLRTRLIQATAEDQAISPDTAKALQAAQDRLQRLEAQKPLRDWQQASASTLLQTMNGRPLDGVQKLPAGTAISPKFMKLRLPAKAYVGPSNGAATVLNDALQANTPILQLATVADGVWVMAWIPGAGYGYVLSTLIVDLEAGQ